MSRGTTISTTLPPFANNKLLGTGAAVAPLIIANPFGGTIVPAGSLKPPVPSVVEFPK